MKRIAWAGAAVGIALGATAATQAQAQPQPQPKPQPQAWFRFTLHDGRVIDVQVVGGDPIAYFVATGGAVYSIPRASVVSMQPLAPPPSGYAPPPSGYAPPPSGYAPPASGYAPAGAPSPVGQPVGYAPAPEPEPQGDFMSRNRRAFGLVYFGAFYFMTASIALARQDDDDDATKGLIPVVGPMAWAVTHDEDDLFEDGWDWLAAFDMVCQGGALYVVLTGNPATQGKRPPVTVTPMSRRGMHGLSLNGSF